MSKIIKIASLILAVTSAFCFTASPSKSVYASDPKNLTIVDTVLTLSGYAKGHTRSRNDGVDYVEIKNNEFYVTMPLNDVPSDEGNWVNAVTLKQTPDTVKLNGKPVTGVTIVKYGATGYYVKLGFSLKRGDELTFNGVFYYDKNGNASFDEDDYGLNISETVIAYDGDVYSQTFADTSEKPYPSFKMLYGASVKLGSAGLGFGAVISDEDYSLLASKDAEFGVLFVKESDLPRSALSVESFFGENSAFSENGKDGKKPFFVDYVSPVKKDDGYLIEGKLSENRIEDFFTEYVGLAFCSLKDGSYVSADFADGDVANNTRSCYYVAQRCVDENDSPSLASDTYLLKADARTETLTVKTVLVGNGRRETVESAEDFPVNSVRTVIAPEIDGYVLLSPRTVSVKIYPNRKNEIVFNYSCRKDFSFTLSAFSLPKLDSSDYYRNDYNEKIIRDIKNAGINTFILSGPAVGNVTSADDVERLKTIADLFWDYGIKTVVDFQKQYFALDYYPDFSDCEGIAGILDYDEPSFAEIDSVVSADKKKYNEVYSDGEKTFLVNLFPYEASRYGSLGENVSYVDYLDRCARELSNLNGKKILSVDTYPVYKDGSFSDDFLLSLGLLKRCALKYGYSANVFLQSSGFKEGNDLKYRLPTENEMRLQALTALCFGVDSLGWFTYGAVSSIGQDVNYAPVGYPDASLGNGYAYLKAVNSEINALLPVRDDYIWQGVIPLKPFLKGYSDGVKNLFDSEFSQYKKQVEATHFSSITVDGETLIGVFESKNHDGKKAMMIINYSAPSQNKTLKVTLKSDIAVKCRPYGKSVTSDFVVNGEYKLTVPAGSGVLLETEV